MLLQHLSSLQHTFTQLAAQLGKEMKKVEKAEGKLKLVTAGFEKRAAAAAELLVKRSADRDEKYVNCAPPLADCSYGVPFGTYCVRAS